MNRSERLEALSRLLSGDLPAEEAAAWRAKIVDDPDVRRDWDAMRALPASLAALPVEPVPAHLLGKTPRSRRVPWRVAAVAAVAVAAVALLAVVPGGTPRVVLADGMAMVHGPVDVELPAGVLSVDGDARVTVEPATPSDRRVPAEDPMHPAVTQLVSAAAGAAVTVLVVHGSATFHPDDGGPDVRIAEGAVRSLGTPKPASPAEEIHVPVEATVPALQARVADLERQLAEAQFTGRLTSGALEAVQGTPVAWPASPPAGARPETFRGRLEAWVADHPGLKVETVDCDEYPCLAMVSGPADPDSRATVESLGDALVDPSFGADPSVMQMASVEDDGEHPRATYGVAIVPGGAMTPDLNTRLKWRMDGLMQEAHPAP